MANLPKNATKWYTPNRQGYILNIGTCFLVDNSGNFLVDNATPANFLVTTATITTPANATAWTATPAS